LQEMMEVAAEQRDKEGGRKNVVLYKIPESNTARAKDQNKTDVNFCLQISGGVEKCPVTHIETQCRLAKADVVCVMMMIHLARYTLTLFFYCIRVMNHT